MNNLFVVRHGDFDIGSTKLNEKGKAQIERIAKLLQDKEVAVYSSLGPRSIESAEIIARLLQVNYKQKEVFGSNSKINQNIFYKRAVNYLKRVNSDVVIVTKGEYATNFIKYFSKRYLGTSFPKQTLKTGQGVVINYQSKSLKLLI